MAPDVSLAQSSPEPQQSSSGLSFTQGFLLGQLSIAVLIFFFIKFFIFGESPSSSDYHLRHHGRSSRAVSFGSSGSRYLTASSKPRTASALRPTNPLTTSAILAKTYYNVRNHQPESVDWFNVLVAQTIAQFRNDAQLDNAILTSVTDLLNSDRKPDYLDEIKVTELSLGEEFPIFSNCRVTTVDENPPDGAAPRSRPSSSSGPGAGAGSGGGKLLARMDVDLSDAITLGIETKILLNYPRPLVAVMPVALAVSVVRFSGTLSISFIPSPAPTPHAAPDPRAAHDPSPPPTTPATDPAPPKHPPTTLTFSFDPSYRLELTTHSLLGSRSRLQDIPKIAQLVEARLHAWFDERCVEPRFQRVVLPSLWPRRGNVGTRGEGEFDGDDGGGGGIDAERNRERETTQNQNQSHKEVLAALEIKLRRQREQQQLGVDGLRRRKERGQENGDDAAGDGLVPPPVDAYGLPGSIPGGFT